MFYEHVEAGMRHQALIVAATALGLFTTLTAARGEITYPWCAQYGSGVGGRNCGFSTLDQCRAAISGNGGYCEENALYRPLPPAHSAVRGPRR